MNSVKTMLSIGSLNNENVFPDFNSKAANNKIKKFNNPRRATGTPYSGGNNAYDD